MNSFDIEMLSIVDALKRVQEQVENSHGRRRYTSVDSGYSTSNVNSPVVKSPPREQVLEEKKVDQEHEEIRGRQLQFNTEYTASTRRVRLTPKQEEMIESVALQLAMFHLDTIKNQENTTINNSRVVGYKIVAQPSDTCSVVIGGCSNRRYPSEVASCAFCQQNETYRATKNGLAPRSHLWLGHRLKDERGNVQCPVLRKHVCPECGMFGDKAHTLRYCQVKKDKEMQRLKYMQRSIENDM